MSAPATFSYAQAAKGQAPVPTNSQTASSSSQMDLHTKDDSSSVTTAADAAANTFSTSSEASESAKSSQMDVEVTASKNTSEDANAGNSDAADAPSKDESSHAARSDEVSQTPSQTTTSEKPTRSSTRSNEPADSRKGRKGKKGRNPEKEAEGDQAQQEPEKEVVSVKLFEAPPPAVNFWQQRAALAQTTKPANAAPVSAGADAPSKATAQDSQKGNSSVEGADASGSENVRPAKSADGSRPLDQRARRNPRGSRVGEQTASGNPPPVEDVALWPTPDTAATTTEETKRKGSVAEPETSTKEKQDDGASSKTSRPKYNVKMDIIPSVRWETQMPQSRAMTKTRGGGQPGRGSVGRGGHASTASVSGEKLQGAGEASAPNSTGDSQGKPREEVAPRTNTLPSEKSKRFSADNQDVRKSSIASGNRVSGASAEYATTSKNGATKASKNESAQGFQGSSRGDGAEQGRKEGGFSGHKDARPRRGGHGGGRGGHNGSQPHGQPFLTNGHSARSNPYSPTFGASGYSYPGTSRGGRGRPMSMNGFKGSANGASKVPMQPIATDFGSYSPYGHAPHSAFPGVSPDYSLIHQALKAQIEYYFSATNLPKDVFLREHMDSQGFVPLEVIADFSRVRGISQRNLNFVREACTDSKDIEYVVGDGEELLRRRDGWEKYVLPEAKRREHARKPGPSNIQYRTRQSPHNTSNYHQQPHMPYPYPAMSPPAFGAQFSGEMYQGYMNAPGYQQGANDSQDNEQSNTDNSQLNAAVPEFAPGTMAINGFIGSDAHAHGAWVEETLQAANVFTDEDVAKLQMVAQGQSEKSPKDAGVVPNGDAPDSTVGYKVAETNGVHTSSDAPNTYVHA